jgi:hypothetical protein
MKDQMDPHRQVNSMKLKRKEMNVGKEDASCGSLGEALL